MYQNKLFRRTRASLSFWYAGVMSLILSILGVGGYAIATRAYWNDLNKDLKFVAETLHQSLELQLKQPGRIESIINKILPNLCLVGTSCSQVKKDFNPHYALSAIDRDNYYVSFFDSSGRLLAVAGFYPEESLLVLNKKAWQTVSDRQGNSYRVTTLLLHTQKSKDWGYLQVGRNLKDYEDYLERAKNILILGLPIALILIGGASWWLAGIAMHPIYQSYTQMEQFSEDVAHELRTPLTTMQTVIESALLKSKLEPNKALNALKTLNRQNQRLIQLVIDLLLLVGTNRKATPLNREPCCLNDLVQDLVEESMSLAIANQVTLTCDLQVSHSLYVLGDSDRLYRLVFNLITNAIQYTSADGKVTVILKRSKHYALIQVQDTGIGIAPSQQKQIFDRFYRVNSDRSRNTGGSGLGLAIAKAIAVEHHANLTVESELGKGSIFTLQLPLIDNSKKKERLGS